MYGLSHWSHYFKTDLLTGRTWTRCSPRRTATTTASSPSRSSPDRRRKWRKLSGFQDRLFRPHFCIFWLSFLLFWSCWWYAFKVKVKIFCYTTAKGRHWRILWAMTFLQILSKIIAFSTYFYDWKTYLPCRGIKPLAALKWTYFDCFNIDLLSPSENNKKHASQTFR